MSHHGSPVVGGGDGPEALLSRCVPAGGEADGINMPPVSC